MRRRLSDSAAAACRWFATHVMGADELLLGTGMALTTAGLWPIADQVALVVPGAVLLWIGLPQRTTFVARSVEKKRPTPQGGD